MRDFNNPKVARLLTAGMAAVVIGTGGIIAGAGMAQDQKKPDSKAEKQPPTKTEKKPEFDPKEVRVGPPPELKALREAVEQAARKGENVDEIRKKLEALETALAGKPWVKPKAQPEPQARDVPMLDPQLRPRFGQPRAAGPELENLQKAQEMMLEALRLQAAGEKEKGEKLMAEAQELLFKGLAGGGLGGLNMQPIPGLLDFGFGLPAVNKGRLGVRVEPVREELAGVPADRGIRVVEVLPGSVADKAGFKADDVVIEFAGKPVTNDAAEFVQAVREAKAGEKFSFIVVRDGKKQTIEGVVLPPMANAAQPLPFPFPKLDEMGALPPLFRKFERGLPMPQGGDESERIAIRRHGNEFTINALDDGVKYLIEGEIENGHRVTTRIVIEDGGEKFETQTVGQLPEKYRDPAEKFLGKIKVVD
jgi:hypothetical protein